jgi:hypothetical protein
MPPEQEEWALTTVPSTSVEPLTTSLSTFVVASASVDVSSFTSLVVSQSGARTLMGSLLPHILVLSPLHGVLQSVSLVACPLASDEAAAPAFIAFFDTGELELSAVTSIFTFWDCQRRVATLLADALLQHWRGSVVIDITAQVSPSGRRGS